MSRAALKDLAEDFYKNKIFIDRFLGREPNLLPNVFMCLMFLKPKQRMEMKRYSGMIYEYYDKAGQMAINGYPMFFSMRVMHKYDVPIFFRYYNKIKKAVEAVTGKKEATSGART
ncbi:MAG: hypothetical protein WC208_10320 [Gallionella sp.]